MVLIFKLFIKYLNLNRAKKYNVLGFRATVLYESQITKTSHSRIGPRTISCLSRQSLTQVDDL